MKPLFDIVLALLGLILLLPVVMLVPIVILAIDRQNPFFLQKRVGYKMSEFTIIKFRTMRDGEITTVGRILRKTGIDEIPQLLNIIGQDMSFVGPRPLTTYDIERLGWHTDFHKMRWDVRPGLVGLAQLSNVCHAKMSWFFDRTYVNTHSFGMDLKIIISSAAVPFVGKSRVREWVHAK